MSKPNIISRPVSTNTTSSRMTLLNVGMMNFSGML
jgi:hypothetical protein